MAKSTFNVQDLVSGVGRTPAYPFQFPSLAQQMLAARPATTGTVRAPVQQGAAAQAEPQSNAPPGPPTDPQGIVAALTAKIPIPMPPTRRV